MTATPCEDLDLVVEPLDSLEVRWMLPGRLRKELRDWFTRFPVTTEARYDVYLLRPRLPGLSVKLRNGNSLDVKSYRGSLGTLTVPGHCRGRLESWRKWSFPYDPGQAEEGRNAGWVAVRKSRWRSWIPLPADGYEAASDRIGNGDPTGNGLAAAGCTVELTEADPGSQPWWSVGFEAIGSADLLDSALRHAAGVVFGCHFPAVTELSLQTSRSYAQWLYEQVEAGAMDTRGPGLIRRADTRRPRVNEPRVTTGRDSLTCGKPVTRGEEPCRGISRSGATPGSLPTTTIHSLTAWARNTTRICAPTTSQVATALSSP